jgi:hypothetical protein
MDISCCFASLRNHGEYMPAIIFFSTAKQPLIGQGLLIIEASRSHQTHHTQQDSSGSVFVSTQKPLPDNTHHSQETDSITPAEFEPVIRASERPQTQAIDRAATDNGCQLTHM